jgi:hypothetical protein
MRLQQSRLALAGEQVLSADVYRSMRVTIDTDSSRVVYRDGTVASVSWPVRGRQRIFAHLPAPIVVPDSGSSIVIDFDLGRSFVPYFGDPLVDFSFTPAVRAVDGAKTGSISGTLLGEIDGDGISKPVQYAQITVVRDDWSTGFDENSTGITGRTDSTGYYKVGFLHPATYSIQIDTAVESFGRLVVHDIEIGAGENFTFSVTMPTGSVAGLSSWR